MTRKTEKKRSPSKKQVAAFADVAVPAPTVTSAQITTVEIADGTSDSQARIAVLAYLMAERRGFAPGFELDDWLAAEAECNGE